MGESFEDHVAEVVAMMTGIPVQKLQKKKWKINENGWYEQYCYWAKWSNHKSS